MDPLVRLTKKHLSSALSSKGTLSKKQYQCLGYDGAFKGWKRSMIGKYFKASEINEFVSLKNAHLANRKQKVSRKKTKPKHVTVHGTYDHPEWIKKRNKILARDKKTCVRCGLSRYDGARLNVHHLLYIKGNDVWDVPDYYLVTLCEKCHKHEHSVQYTPPSRIFNADGTRRPK